MQLRFGLFRIGLAASVALGLGCSTGMVRGSGEGTGSAGAPGAGGSSGGATTNGSAGVSGAAGDTGGPSGSAGSATTGGGGTGDTSADAGPIDAAAPIGDAGDALAGWVLSWSDEFNAPAGTKPDPKYWGYDLGGGGWGVSQIQTYTSDAANAATDGQGNLAITAIKDSNGNFTSARIKTQGKFQQAYGRFEMRAKITTGNGMWPAFWTLGDDFDSAGWPQCGEIDIMEVRGTQPLTNLGSLHGPGYSGSNPLTGHYSLPDGGATLSDDFHTYAIEWETKVVRFYVDDHLYETRTPADIPESAGGAAKWVYDHPFFILLNVAVGGKFPGSPDGTTFPQTMLVDYIRVYSRPNASP